MNVKDLYEDRIIAAKWKEAKWFSWNDKGESDSSIKHRLPFLCRNVTYIRRNNKGRANRTLDTAAGSTGNGPFIAAEEKLDPSEKDDDDDEYGTVSSDSASLSSTVLEQKRQATSIRRTSLSPLSDDGSSSSVRSSRCSDTRLTGGGTNRSTTKKAETQMSIHLLFLDDSGAHIQTMVEDRGDRRCPFCLLDTVTDDGLMKHLHANHDEEFSFEAARIERGELHVLVTPVPESYSEQEQEPRCPKDFMFFAFSQKSQDASVLPFVVKRPLETIASFDPVTRKKKARLLVEEMGAKTRQEVQRYIPDDVVPARQYYHSKTTQRMVGRDWDEDSDNDSTNEQWLFRMNEALIDEFEDVSLKEKKFMKLWNTFVRSHTVIPDTLIPGKCIDFIRTHAADLKENDLRNDLSLHLMNLWENSLVSSDHMSECLMEYDALAN